MENDVQLLHTNRRLQDENAGFALNNKQAHQQGGPSLKAAPLSARKAFGNITNTNKASAAAEGAVGVAASKPRRALGELPVNSNWHAQRQAEQEGSEKPTTAGHPVLRIYNQSVVKGAEPDALVAPQQQQQQQQQSLAQKYAASGVEQYAGKTWMQLEEDIEEREDSQAAAAAQQLAARLGSWRPGVLRVRGPVQYEWGARRWST
jgi:hypothetical protein